MRKLLLLCGLCATAFVIHEVILLLAVFGVLKFPVTPEFLSASHLMFNFLGIFLFIALPYLHVELAKLRKEVEVLTDKLSDLELDLEDPGHLSPKDLDI